MTTNKNVKQIVTITLLVSLTAMFSGCGASPECCNCVERHSCKWNDVGACNSVDPCQVDDDNDNNYDDDESNALDGILALAQLICLIINPRHMDVSRSCAERNGCVSQCSGDERFINYKSSSDYLDEDDYFSEW